MYLTVNGDFGNVVLSQNGVANTFSVPVGSAIQFFKGFSIQKKNILLDTLGTYTIATAGRAKDIRIASLSTPRNLFHKRTGGCQWNPQGKSVQQVTTINLDPFEYDGEQCPDADWGSCLESLFAPGLGNEDYYSTPEASALIAELLQKVYIGLGNSFYDSITWGNHPLIDTADTAGSYDMSAEDWADFKKNNSITSGHMTIVDGLKAQGLPQYNVQINAANVSGNTYTGSAEDLFESLINAMPIEMQAMQNTNPDVPLILSVTTGIFQKYRKELITKFNGIREGYLLQTKSADGMVITNPNALWYNNMIVVNRTDWAQFYSEVGIYGHRAMIHTPGVFAIGLDIQELDQFEGMGMRVDQVLMPPYKGKIFMHTIFKAGAAVLDQKQIVNASLHLA